ncbi:MAG: hypothetical protein AMXMBFR84_03000 [Candidatus Hydrogenedentota bacterium]
MAIKNTVYVLPNREESIEDFQWLLNEIKREGGEGVVCDAGFVEGLTDADIIRLFNARAETQYSKIARDARTLLGAIKTKSKADRVDRLEAAFARLCRNLERTSERDYFSAKGGRTVRSLLDDIKSLLKAKTAENKRSASPGGQCKMPRGGIWVTRKNIFVDRMASAWLIKRFVDPQARFKYVEVETYRHRTGELRFDMYEGEFTHRGSQCTFEVLCDSFHLHDPAISQLAEIVHDIDMKDGKYAREEAMGIALVLRSIRSSCRNDVDRLTGAVELFNILYDELIASTKGR